MWGHRLCPLDSGRDMLQGLSAHELGPQLQPHWGSSPPSSQSCLPHLSQGHLPRALPSKPAHTASVLESVSRKLSLRQPVMSEPLIRKVRGFPDPPPLPPLEQISAVSQGPELSPSCQGACPHCRPQQHQGPVSKGEARNGCQGPDCDIQFINLQLMGKWEKSLAQG